MVYWGGEEHHERVTLIPWLSGYHPQGQWRQSEALPFYGWWVKSGHLRSWCVEMLASSRPD